MALSKVGTRSNAGHLGELSGQERAVCGARRACSSWHSAFASDLPVQPRPRFSACSGPPLLSRAFS